MPTMPWPLASCMSVRGRPCTRVSCPKSSSTASTPVLLAEGWARHLSGSTEGAAVVVAEMEGEVVGFVSIGPSREEDGTGRGEVLAIYLLPEQWGQGIGRELMEAALDQLRQMGFREATLWVLDTNERAWRFYEAGGWVVDRATKQDNSRGFPITEVRYRRTIN